MPDIKLTGAARRWEKRAGSLEAKVQATGKFLEIFDTVSDKLSEPLKKQVGSLKNIQTTQKDRLKTMENAVRLEKLIHRDIGELNTVRDVFRQGIKDSVRSMKDLTMGIIETFDDLLDTFLGPLWRFTKRLVGGLGIFGGRLFKVTIGKWFFGMGKKEADVGKDQLEVLTDVRDELYKQLKTNPNLGEHIMSMDESLKGLVGFQPEMMRFMDLLARGNNDIQYFWKENRELEEEAEDTRHRTLIETLRGVAEDFGDKTSGLFSKVLAATGIKKLYDSLKKFLVPGTQKGIPTPPTAPGPKLGGPKVAVPLLGGGIKGLAKMGLWTAFFAVVGRIVAHEVELGLKKGLEEGSDRFGLNVAAQLMGSPWGPIGLPMTIMGKDAQKEMLNFLENIAPQLKAVNRYLGDVAKHLGPWAKGMLDSILAGDWQAAMENMKKLGPALHKWSGEFLDTYKSNMATALQELKWQLEDWSSSEWWKKWWKKEWERDISFWKSAHGKGPMQFIFGPKTGKKIEDWWDRETHQWHTHGRIPNLPYSEMYPELYPEEIKKKTEYDTRLLEAMAIPGIDDLTDAIGKLIESTERLYGTNEELRKKKGVPGEVPGPTLERPTDNDWINSITLGLPG